jgi:hypothetical protein
LFRRRISEFPDKASFFNLPAPPNQVLAQHFGLPVELPALFFRLFIRCFVHEDLHIAYDVLSYSRLCPRQQKHVFLRDEKSNPGSGVLSVPAKKGYFKNKKRF